MSEIISIWRLISIKSLSELYIGYILKMLESSNFILIMLNIVLTKGVQIMNGGHNFYYRFYLF